MKGAGKIGWARRHTRHAFGMLGWICLGAGCIKSRPCENVIREENPSPNGRLKAVVFERRCPDLGQRSTQISILMRGGSLSDGSGNIFAADDSILVKVGWQSDDKLVVYSLADLDRGTHLTKAGEVAIEYEQMMETDLLPPLDSHPPAASPSAAAILSRPSAAAPSSAK